MVYTPGGMPETLGSLPNDYLQKQLGTAMGLQTGTTQPWNTPEFASLSDSLSKGFMNQRSELEKVMAAKGITGGAAADMFNNLNSQDMSTKLGAINQIRQHYGDIGGNIANQDLSRQMQEWQTTLDNAFKNRGLELQSTQFQQNMAEKIRESNMDAWTAYKARHTQIAETRASGQAQMGQWFGNKASSGGASGGGGGGGCCFIFIQGEGVLTDSVRRYRDSHYGNNSDVANGYRWMASWLVPLMAKNKLITWVIRIFMTKPLTEYSLGNSVYMPFKIWPVIWNLIGKIRRM